MKLFGTVKNGKCRTSYFFGIKVYERLRNNATESTYILGIRIQKKSLHKPSTKLDTAELKILTLGLYYKDLPKEERPILCFDHLAYPYAEAIDAWTFFQYLQSQGIPSIYVIREENPLFQKLQAENRLKDIISVKSELQFLQNYPHIIAQSRAILSSFALDISEICKILPSTKYIFIEHGVSFLIESALELYSPSRFDGMLVPTRLTKQVYEQRGSETPACPHYCVGFPRWDKLAPAQKKGGTKKIFIFFTWREALSKNKTFIDLYTSRIQSFIKRLRGQFANKPDIQIQVSLHHVLLDRGIAVNKDKLFEGVQLVPVSEISQMIREADLCITDFSSISFDFLYRNVPVIYYCFDADIQYTEKHDQMQSSIAKIKQELYNYCDDEDAAVDKALYYADRDFELEPEYVQKNNSIFWQHGKNCETFWQLLKNKL